jgi:hypothetical protein
VHWKESLELLRHSRIVLLNGVDESRSKKALNSDEAELEDDDRGHAVLVHHHTGILGSSA